MDQVGFLVRLDQLSSSYLVILGLLLVLIAAGFLFHIGLIQWAMVVFASVVRHSIRHGFQVWQRLFSWTSWPTFLSLVLMSLFVGWWMSRSFPALTVVCALIPLFMGVTACLAYMLIDLERYAVSRGYKSVHNPLKGQELAVNLVRYGQAVGVPLLVTATVGMIGGFALLNLGLYETIGRNWYIVKEGQGDPTYVDFVANALIVLLRIVDVLDFAKASHLLEVSYVRQAKWPASTLLAVFRMFFTLVLLQQIFASFRQGQVLSETITDLWNPNEPIHERACHALPQHGAGAIGPLLVSLGSVTSLTKEQRERLPVIFADIGPAAIPALVRHLHDEHEHVRAIAAGALGHLRVRGTIVLLVSLSRDSSDIVRQSLIEALGIIASSGFVPSDAQPTRVTIPHRLWRSLKWRSPFVAVSSIEPVDLAVQTLQAALADSSLSVRAQAARALGRIGPPAVVAASSLVGLLKDEDETVRQAAIEAVGKVGGSTAAIVDALVEVLQDASPSLRVLAARELGAMGAAASEAFSALAPLLQDRDESVRDAAAEAIGQIGHLNDEATEGLVVGLVSPDSVVRAQAAEALGTIGESAQGTAPSLVDVLTDQNDTVRAKAVEALGKIGEAVADVAVIGLVRALRDQDNVVSSLAAEALGQMGELADVAIPSLIYSLQHINADVRASAAKSLGKLGVEGEGAANVLEVACRDEDANVRCQAIRALSVIDQPTPVTKQIVLGGLNDTDSRVRTAAVDALGRWGNLDEGSVSLLLSLLEDPNELVRAHVTTILPWVAGTSPAVIEGLCRRLRDDSDLVQAQAAQALGELGSAAATAGETLLHAAQTGEASVRERARQAIVLIRPSETLASMDEATVEPGLIDALREIENQTQSISEELPLDVIPIIVTSVVITESGQQVDAALTLEIILPNDVGNAIQKQADDADSDDTNRHE